MLQSLHTNAAHGRDISASKWFPEWNVISTANNKEDLRLETV
jgi:hypothetical protein